YAAAELWRRHGSLPVAEKDYLMAARLDRARFGPRGLLGAGDVQRRQNRAEDALASYRKAIESDPTSPPAQRARLETAKLLQVMGRSEDAIAAGRIALESARSGRQTIAAANRLALLLIAHGDLDAAAGVIERAEQVPELDDHDDPAVAARLRKAVQAMSARRALQRASDKKNEASTDAVRLDAERRGG
ncbi:MAG: tetratricopeptide repeat protein, partial [Planctomycetes bacterium]|nr:tetratricopeptide repeat protein [Planctomycetota bacterium]